MVLAPVPRWVQACCCGRRDTGHPSQSWLSNIRAICLAGFVCFCVTAGQERLPDQEMGDGKGLDMARRCSVTSVESTVSSGTQTAIQDDPEQFEVIKQQKELIEHGIEL